ncbi:hypothetical protein ACFL5O_08745 [Myxococcota bacterium]
MSSPSKFPVSLGFLCAIVLHCGSVLAEPADAASLSDSDVNARIDRLQAVLDERASRVQIWQYGWGGLGYAVTGGFVGLAATQPNGADERLDFAFAAGGAFIDTTIHMLGSINVHAASRVRSQAASTPAEARLKLKFAEAQLAEAAEMERDRRSVLKGHLLPVGLTVVSGLVLGLGFGHVKGAVINTIAGTAIAEIRVWTQPTSSIAKWEQYQRDPSALAAKSGRHESDFGWSLALAPTGCGVVGTF